MHLLQLAGQALSPTLALQRNPGSVEPPALSGIEWSVPINRERAYAGKTGWTHSPQLRRLQTPCGFHTESCYVNTATFNNVHSCLPCLVNTEEHGAHRLTCLHWLPTLTLGSSQAVCTFVLKSQKIKQHIWSSDLLLGHLSEIQ